MIYVGIDPGQNGGVSSVSDSGLTCSIPMLDSKELSDLLELWHRDFSIKHVFLEYAQAMPKQGVVSMFNYGKHFGTIIGLLVAGGYPYTLITPRIWQAEMFAGTRKFMLPKKRALEVAKRLFPKENFLKTPRCIKPHDGMIDSILIAEYCRRTIR
jgi:hypothetical protein